MRQETFSNSFLWHATQVTEDYDWQECWLLWRRHDGAELPPFVFIAIGQGEQQLTTFVLMTVIAVMVTRA